MPCWGPYIPPEQPDIFDNIVEKISDAYKSMKSLPKKITDEFCNFMEAQEPFVYLMKKYLGKKD